MAHLGRGVTVYKGRGGLSGEDQEILYLRRDPAGDRQGEGRSCMSLDPNAFVTSHPLADVDGGMVKRGGCTRPASAALVA